ncbi:uncharacterized protein LOC135373404 [Ornithodoros turicata]|uniref:uncharacterized protein LOC135373404 n=1 Tax=Ornithodoros turicata TaxID=34597 RepID=UPI00313A3D55
MLYTCDRVVSCCWLLCFSPRRPVNADTSQKSKLRTRVLSFSPHGQCRARISSSLAGSCRWLFCCWSGRTVHPVTTEKSKLRTRGLSFSPHGQCRARISSSLAGSCRWLFCCWSGRTVHTVTSEKSKRKHPGHRTRVLSFSPHGQCRARISSSLAGSCRWLFCCWSGRTVHTVTSEKSKRKHPGHRTRVLSFSPHGQCRARISSSLAGSCRWLFCCWSGRTVHTVTSEKSKRKHPGHRTRVLSFSPHGQCRARISSSLAGSCRWLFCCWSGRTVHTVTSEKSKRKHPGHRTRVLSFSPHGQCRARISSSLAGSCRWLFCCWSGRTVHTVTSEKTDSAKFCR